MLAVNMLFTAVAGKRRLVGIGCGCC